MRKNRFLNTLMTLLVSMTLCCFSTNVYAQNNVARKNTTTAKSQKKSYNWDMLIKAIAKVESEENPNAVSANGKYVGYLQIGPIIVKDCNAILGEQKYTLNDRYSVEKSKEMFVIIQERYNPEHSTEKAIRLWNGGCKYSVSKTQAYYNKVMRKFNETAQNR